MGDFNHYVPSVAASPGFSLHHTESNVQDHSSLPRLVQGQTHLPKKFLQVHTFFPRIDERPVLSGNRRRVSHLWSCSHRRPSVEVEQSDLVAGGNSTVCWSLHHQVSFFQLCDSCANYSKMNRPPGSNSTSGGRGSPPSRYHSCLFFVIWSFKVNSHFCSPSRSKSGGTAPAPTGNRRTGMNCANCRYRFLS